MGLSTLASVGAAIDPTLLTVGLGAGAIGAVSGALGCFAYLRRQGLVGDVVSHSALFGVVGAFVLSWLVTGEASKSLFVLIPGALVAGTAALLLSRVISTRTRLKEDTSLGVMLAIFFGSGLLMLRWVQRHTPPIRGHTGLEDYIFGMAAAMTHADVVMIATLGAIALAVLFLCWKEFKVYTFDPDFARSLGFSGPIVDTLLLTTLVLGVVIGIQSVGVILMIALLVTPASAARQWTSRLGPMVALAAAFGAASGVAGALVSASEARLPTGPVIVLFVTAIFALSLLCALSGTFLVLKREALVSEGLAHAVLPGIVIAYVVLRDRTSPLLIVGAAAMGLVMILLVHAIQRTKVVDETASLGVVFPALFSIGILLASAELSNTHFHADCIIDGNLALAPLDRLELGGVDVGPRAFWSMAAVLLLVLGFVTLFFKELKLMTFDEGLAASLGFKPGLLHVAWLGLVSITTVTAFEAAGSILVVALMIAPPAAANLWTDDLRRMIGLAGLFGLASAGLGYWIGFGLDVAPNGPMASSAGLVFLVSLFLAPRGLLARGRATRRTRTAMEVELLVGRLEGTGARARAEVADELGWKADRFDAVVGRAVAGGEVRAETGDGLVTLARPTR